MDQHGEEPVCKVLKSIYGLKQAPRNWNKTVSAWLVEYGFKQSTVDPCIYTFAAAGDLYILALYVDDSIMAGPPGSFISVFGGRLASASTFKIWGRCLSYWA